MREYGKSIAQTANDIDKLQEECKQIEKQNKDLMLQLNEKEEKENTNDMKEYKNLEKELNEMDLLRNRK